jgi:hypothetical protein
MMLPPFYNFSVHGAFSPRKDYEGAPGNVVKLNFMESSVIVSYSVFPAIYLITEPPGDFELKTNKTIHQYTISMP